VESVHRAGLARRARLLAWGGNAWHLVEFAIAVAAGVAAGSIEPDECDRPGGYSGRDRDRELDQMPCIPAPRQQPSATRQARAMDRFHVVPKLDRLHAFSVVRHRAQHGEARAVEGTANWSRQSGPQPQSVPQGSDVSPAPGALLSTAGSAAMTTGSAAELAGRQGDPRSISLHLPRRLIFRGRAYRRH